MQLTDNIPTPFPILETERLVLREVMSTDTEALCRLYSDEQVMKYRGAPAFRGNTEAFELMKAFKLLFQSKAGIRWALVFKGKEDELLGTAGLKNIQWQHFRGEIGYELFPAFWNKGLMTEALRAITTFCFETYRLHTLEANIAPDNSASKRVLHKLGFKKEAHYKENYYYKGWWDSVIYTLHRDEQKNCSPV